MLHCTKTLYQGSHKPVSRAKTGASLRKPTALGLRTGRGARAGCRPSVGVFRAPSPPEPWTEGVCCLWIQLVKTSPVLGNGLGR